MSGKGKKILSGVLVFFVLLAGGFLWYVNDDYDATAEALSALESNELVEVTGEDPVHFQSVESTDEVGIIFYPGGKVEEEAYALLMQQLAVEGYQVFLLDVPFGLAVFDINAAEDVIAENPQIKNWYVAGHSLGGSMAAIFASNTIHELAGVILLASYSTADLTQLGIPVLSIYGSEDHVLNMEKLAEYRPMLPEDHLEVIIEGGNHAQFGNYGEQAGDGTGTISSADQQKMTVEEIKQFIEIHQE